MSQHKVTNYRAMLKLLGIIVMIIGIAEFIPMIYALITADYECTFSFFSCSIGTFFVGLCMYGLIQTKRTRFGAREGYLIVAMTWIVASLIGAIPFMMSSYTSNFIDSFFESVAGFTTTGCTAFADTHMPRALLLWKALMNWLGGMGILVFVISILPALGINGQIIAKAEAPGPVLEKTTVRMSDSAKVLYLTYLTFTVSEFIMLMLSGKISLYDNVITTLGSISTGGLLVHPEGIAYYDSFYIEAVISLFCILSSINFMIYHYALRRDYYKILKNTELRVFLMIIIIAIGVCTVSLTIMTDSTLSSAARDSFFQVISFSTTAGYTRSPYKMWPAVCQMLLLLIMLIGGCSSSTSGSLKVMRVTVMFRMVIRGCIKKRHPNAVVPVRVGESSIPAPVVSSITVFSIVFMLMLLLSTVVLSLQGFDFETSFSSSLAMLSNTGAAFGHAASLGNFSFYHPALKIYLCMLMIVGRLEIFPIIMLFTTNLWGRKR